MDTIHFNPIKCPKGCAVYKWGVGGRYLELKSVENQPLPKTSNKQNLGEWIY